MPIKMKKILLLLLTLLFALSIANGQDGPDNFIKTKSKKKKAHKIERPRQTKEDFQAIELNTFTVFAVKIRVLYCGNESKEFIVKKINQSFERANNAFYDAALRFEIDGKIEFGCDSSFSNFLKTNANEEMLYNKYCKAKEEKQINLFVVGKISNPDNLIDGTLGYAYMPYYQRIFCREFIILHLDGTAMSGTLSHELGHFFGLHHTHGDDHTFEKELASGANCAWAGDSICDTPADRPNLLKNRVDAIGADCSCKYTGKEVDENYDLLQPLADNIMSYTPDKCRRKFTAGQLNKISQYARWRRLQLKQTIDKKQKIIWDTELTTTSLVNAKESFLLNNQKRNVLLFAYHPENIWCQKIYFELSQPYLQEILQKYDYKVMLFNVTEDRELIDFFGNDVVFLEAFNSLQKWLRKEIVHFPALITIRFDQDRERRIVSSLAFGYMNPRTMKKVLIKNGFYRPERLGK